MRPWPIASLSPVLLVPGAAEEFRAAPGLGIVQAYARRGRDGLEVGKPVGEVALSRARNNFV